MEPCHEELFAVNKAAAAAWGVNRSPRKPCEKHLIVALTKWIGSPRYSQPWRGWSVRGRPPGRGSPSPRRDPGNAWVCAAAGSQANCVQEAWGAASQPAAVKTLAGLPGRPGGSVAELGGLRPLHGASLLSCDGKFQGAVSPPHPGS